MADRRWVRRGGVYPRPFIVGHKVRRYGPRTTDYGLRKCVASGFMPDGIASDTGSDATEPFAYVAHKVRRYG
jgi:hypothetical protein